MSKFSKNITKIPSELGNKAVLRKNAISSSTLRKKKNTMKSRVAIGVPATWRQEGQGTPHPTRHLLPQHSIRPPPHHGLRQTPKPEPADEFDDSALWRPSMSSSPFLAPHAQTPLSTSDSVLISVSTSGPSNSINTQTYGRNNKTQGREPLFLKNKPGPKYQMIAKRALTEVY